jgi:hypothetical protein
VAHRRWHNGERVHGESISGLTGARAAVWRPGDDGEEMAEEALNADGTWAQRREGGWGEVRWRTVGLSLYIGAEGEAASGD